MTTYRLVLFVFFLSIIISCQNKQEGAYYDLLASGIELSTQDTTVAKVGEQLLFPYYFSAGVQPIYYQLNYFNSDTTVLEYKRNPTFYLDDEDIDGGRSAGLFIFEGKKEGLARLEFYNLHDNVVAHQLPDDEFAEWLPLHKDLETSVCYIRIKN
ncbi:hypothetical protein [Aureispira anguillae]|uniref:Uncharacterized protein n=1 Tax=Aureispira anguillae TaxID=2864201 RepID=A0A915VK06_9BACT|nr:hypothetical protein [Aureispira anguillae]BDS09447.1 hypothetical protein AsAng_0001450 [Aureispira anguillae]